MAEGPVQAHRGGCATVPDGSGQLNPRLSRAINKHDIIYMIIY